MKRDIFTIGEHNAIYEALEQMASRYGTTDELIATFLLNQLDDSKKQCVGFNEEQHAACTLPILKARLKALTQTIASIREEIKAIQS